jgi:hypothetical protein
LGKIATTPPSSSGLVAQYDRFPWSRCDLKLSLRLKDRQQNVVEIFFKNVTMLGGFLCSVS